MPFLNQDLLTRSRDGHNFTLLEPLDYIANDGRHLRAMKGATTDGLSVPQTVWSIIPPFGKGWFAGILHDAAYRGSLCQIIDDKQVTITMDKGQRDSLLSEALEAQGVPDAERLTIYEAVRYGGESSFENDLSLPIP